MPVHRSSVLLGRPLQQIARDPSLVASGPRALRETLELPLPRGHFGVDAFDVEARFEAEVEMLLDDLASKGVRGSHGAVIRALRSGKATCRESKREISVRIPQEVLLLEAEPEIVVVILDRRPGVRFVRGPVGVQHFGHHQKRVEPPRVGEDRDGLQQTIRRATGGLLCRASVERPHGAVLEATAEVSQNFGFATQALSRMIPVQPDVLQFRFCHGPVGLWGKKIP